MDQKSFYMSLIFIKKDFSGGAGSVGGHDSGDGYIGGEK